MSRALACLAVALALLPAARWAASLPREVPTPADLMYPESVVAWNAAELRAGRPLYRDWRTEPHVIAPYAPLGYALAALLSDGTALGARLAGRVISVAAALLLATLLAAIVHRARRRSAPSRLAPASDAALAVGFFLGSALLSPYGFSARPDLTATALSLLGVALGAGLLGRRRPVAAAIACVLAVLAKQTAVAAPASLLALFVVERDGRAAVRFSVLFGLGVGIPVVLTQVVTRGAFLDNVLAGNAAPFAFSHVFRTGTKALAAGLSGVPFALALLWLVAGGGRSCEPAVRALGLYGSIALTIGLLSLAKTGSDENYLIESATAAAALASMGLSSEFFRREIGGGFVAKGLAAAWGVAVIALGGWAPTGDAAVAEAKRQEAISILAETPGTIWAQPPDIAVACGKPVVMLDSYNFSLLEIEGLFDPGPFAERIRRGEFAAVLLDFDPFDPRTRAPTYQGAPRVSPALVDALRERYRVRAPIGRYRLLEPLTSGT